MPNRLHIRANATQEIGGGHLMRCLCLADEWAKTNSHEVNFYGDCTSENLRAEISKRSFTWQPSDESLLNTSGNNEWVIVDSYSLTNTYTSALQAAGYRVLVIDDIADQESYVADILLNQNAYAPKLKYQINKEAQLLLGSPYCLLRNEFKNIGAKPIAQTAHNILITLGAGDNENYTQDILDYLDTYTAHRLYLRPLLGPANSHTLKPPKNHACEIITAPEKVSEHMTWCDIAISAAGSTIWELSATGVPTIALCIEENQAQIASYIRETQIGIAAYDIKDINEDVFASILNNAITNNALRQQISLNAQNTIDGLGAKRVVEAMA
jgi:UDP-2,4-diacetamido-2,4,6-trideoxy-beta-L-altropyranose hydrolase